MPTIDISSVDYQTYLNSTSHPLASMTLSVGATHVNLTIELFTTLVPNTVSAFQSRASSGHYSGFQFDRLVGGGWLQMSGPASAGVPLLPDESFAAPFDAAGVVGLTNAGPHSNGDKLFITLRPAEWLAGKYVAIGRIVKGIEELEAAIDAIQIVDEKPSEAISIVSIVAL
jgi:cyclophilin family peptidyl-prolyl cis-trans isomerase